MVELQYLTVKIAFIAIFIFNKINEGLQFSLSSFVLLLFHFLTLEMNNF